MSLLERRRNLMGAFKGFIRTILGIPPISLISCIGNKDAISYKIYGNSVQNGTPTPDTPIEIESVGEPTINLFNKDTITNSFALNDGKKVANGLRFVSDYIDCSDINYVSINLAGGFAWYDENKEIVSYENKSTTIFRNYSKPDGAIYLMLDFHKDTIKPDDVMCVSGTYKASTMPEYEPYGKYKIPVKASGKNLIPYPYSTKDGTISGVTFTTDENGVLTIDGTLTIASTGFIFFNKNNGVLKDGVNYRLSNNVIIKYKDENGVSKWANSQNTLTWKKEYILEMCYMSIVGTYNNKKVYPQLEIGTVATEYEPYIEPVTKNIFLNEPLRKIGNYADYIDFENSKVVRLNRTRKVKSSALYSYNNSLTNIAVFRSTQDIFSDSNKGSIYDTINKCDKLKYRNGGAMSTVAENSGEFLALRTGAFYVSFNKDRFVDDITEEKALEYLNNLNATVIYPLATPKEETIELPKLSTFKGTTVYSIDTTIQPSNMEAIYYSKEREM